MGNQTSSDGLESADSEFAINVLDNIPSQHHLSCSSTKLSSHLSNPPNAPLRFHSKHGDHVEISPDATVAKRLRSYCRGIVFTNRPIRRNEMVCFRIKEQTGNQQQWSGALRIGITNQNPADVDLSNALYLCPDLTNRPGFWARPCPELPDVKDKVLHFQCLDNSTIVYGVNGVKKGIAFEDVDTSRPLWGAFDVYGTTIAIELLDPAVLPSIKSLSKSLGSRLKLTPDSLSGISSISSSPVTRTASLLSGLSRPSAEKMKNTTENGGDAFSARNVPNNSQGPSAIRTNSARAPQNYAISSSSPSLINTVPPSNPRYRPRHFPNIELTHLRFHKDLIGRNVRLSDEGRCARLAGGEFSNGYAFTPRPVVINETILIRIVENDWDFNGGLAFGVTTCNPDNLCQANLPDDADCLLDRPEYWIVAKDVATKPKEGEEFSFTIRANGNVQISRNNNKATDFLFVDASQTFWMFFELYGTTRKIALLGSYVSGRSSNAEPSLRSTPMPHHRPRPTQPQIVDLRPAPRQISSTITPQSSPQSSVTSKRTTVHTSLDLIDLTADLSVPRDSGTNQSKALLNRSTSVPVEATSSAASVEFSDGECCVCFEKGVNCVIYTCGHQVMCYECAIVQFRQKKLCPICRSEIKDVIRTFRA